MMKKLFITMAIICFTTTVSASSERTSVYVCPYAGNVSYHLSKELPCLVIFEGGVRFIATQTESVTNHYNTETQEIVSRVYSRDDVTSYILNFADKKIELAIGDLILNCTENDMVKAEDYYCDDE